MKGKLLVGTRGSDLALTQTRFVIKQLNDRGFQAREKVITTKGDKDKRPFADIAGDGFFTKEIEHQLLNNEVQIAIHSAKDLPSMYHSELPWGAFGEREDSCDVLILNRNAIKSESPLELKAGSRVGTSSPRRVSQAKQSFEGIEICELRGNVPTRLNKVLEGEFDGVILAKAGLNRLGLLKDIDSKLFHVEELPWAPAPCQGILAIQARKSDVNISEVTEQELTDIAWAEKSVLAFLGGGCHLPVGARISKYEGGFEIDFFLDDGETVSEFQLKGRTLSHLLQRTFQEIVGTYSFENPRVWITSPLQHHLRIAKTLAQNDLYFIHWPLIQIFPNFDVKELSRLTSEIDSYDSLAFSSQFAARIFLQEWGFHNFDRIKEKVIYAVGKKTAAVLEEAGLEVKVPANATGSDLAKMITGKSVLVPSAKDSKLTEALKSKGLSYKHLVLYETLPSLGLMTQTPPTPKDEDTIVFTSPSAVEAYIQMTKTHQKLIKLKKIALGPTTLAALKEHGLDAEASPESGDWEQVARYIQKRENKKESQSQ